MFRVDGLFRLFCEQRTLRSNLAGTQLPPYLIALRNVIYQFAEAAIKFNVKDFFDAVSACAFIMHERVKLVF
jgi:hypothetical protein